MLKTKVGSFCETNQRNPTLWFKQVSQSAIAPEHCPRLSAYILAPFILLKWSEGSWHFENPRVNSSEVGPLFWGGGGVEIELISMATPKLPSPRPQCFAEAPIKITSDGFPSKHQLKGNRSILSCYSWIGSSVVLRRAHLTVTFGICLMEPWANVWRMLNKIKCSAFNENVAWRFLFSLKIRHIAKKTPPRSDLQFSSYRE